MPIEGWQRLGPLPGASPTFTRAQNSSATPDVVIGSTYAGIVRSHDGGVSWSHVSPWPGNIRNYGLATVSDTDPNRLIAQCFFFGTFTSSDGGATWSPSAVSPAAEFILDVRFAPSCGPIAFAHAIDSTLWRTADHGEHWHAFYDALDPVSDFAVVPGNPLFVVLATAGSRGASTPTPPVRRSRSSWIRTTGRRSMSAPARRSTRRRTTARRERRTRPASRSSTRSTSTGPRPTAFSPRCAGKGSFVATTAAGRPGRWRATSRRR